MPVVLGSIEIGPGEQHAVVRLERLAAPHLLAVDDPSITVADRTGGEPGEIRARSRLAEELAPGDTTVEDRGDQSFDLFRGPVGQDRGRGHQETEPTGRTQCPVRGEGGSDGCRRPTVEASTPLLGGEVRGRPSGLGDDAPPVGHLEVRVPVVGQPGANLLPELRAREPPLIARPSPSPRPPTTRADRGSCHA